MTTVARTPVTTQSHLALWAWICDALTPVVLVLLIALGLANEGGSETGNWWTKAVITAIAVAAPVAGIILGLLGHRKSERTGMAAAIVATVLLVATPIGLFLLVI